MGNTCKGSCYSKNEYDVDIEVLLSKKQKGNDDLNCTNELNQSFRIQPDVRVSLLKEEKEIMDKVYNKDFEKTNLGVIHKLQNAVKKY